MLDDMQQERDDIRQWQLKHHVLLSLCILGLQQSIVRWSNTHTHTRLFVSNTPSEEVKNKNQICTHS